MRFFLCLTVMTALMAQGATAQTGAATGGFGSLSPGERISVRKSATQPHAFDIDVAEGGAIELVNVAIRENGATWGSYSIVMDPPRSSVSFQTASFRFLPSSYEIEVTLDNGAPLPPSRFGPFYNQIQKMIIVDRDAYPQRALMIEGDSWFLFGRLVSSSEISTGLTKLGGTPLGYYHLRNKEIDAYNAVREWKMPYAHWYTPTNYPEGVNGLHEGFEGTVYGIRQSNGCTRMPTWFSKALWQWSEIGIPVIYIGNEYQTMYDRGRFDVTDYPLFKGLIRDMMLYHQGLKSGRETPTYFTPEQAALVDRMQPFQNDLLDSCANFLSYTRGAQFNQVVSQFALLRGAD